MKVNEEDAWTLLSALFATAQVSQRGIASHPQDPITIRLLALAAERGSLRPSEAAAELDVAPPTITRHVKALEQQGCLVAAANPGDGRSYVIKVSEAGYVALKRFRKELVAKFMPALNDFTPDEIHSLAGLLNRLISGMAAQSSRSTGKLPKNRWLVG